MLNAVPAPQGGTRPQADATPLVYVVDDDVSVRESLELLIRFAGWQPVLFDSARAFLDHAFHDIAGLRGLLGLIDDLGDRLDHENEDQAAQNGADDLVPLEGIHSGKLP